MRVTSCRACGTPCRGGICGGCKEAASYASPEYRQNRAEMMRAAAEAYAIGMKALCCICGRKVLALGELSVEHVTRLMDGGTHARENLDYAHLSCNSRMMPAPERLVYRRPQ